MKKLLNITAIYILSAILFCGCTDEAAVSLAEETTQQQTRSLEVTIDGTNTQGDTEKIERVRFIVFDDISSGGKLDVNKLIEVTEGNDVAVNGFKARLKVVENSDKLIVAIVNEPMGKVTGGSDESDTWQARLTAIKYPSQLTDMTMDLADALNGQTNPVTDAEDLSPSGLPMVGMLWANIPGSSLAIEPDDAITWPEPIVVERILSRVDVYLKNDDNSKKGSITSSTKIEILNSGKKGYLCRGAYKNRAMHSVDFGHWLTTADDAYDKETNLFYTPTSTSAISNTGSGEDGGQHICSFYVPEWKYDTGKADSADKLGITFSNVLDSNGATVGGTFYLSTAAPAGSKTEQSLDGIERNNVYQLTGIIKAGVAKIIFAPTVTPWVDAADTKIDEEIEI